MKKVTEQDSHHQDLDLMSTRTILESINREDHVVPQVIKTLIPQISNLVDAIVDRMIRGGRLFYIGAGTSGRLGIVDASECPPTFGVDHGVVIGIIAGGDQAIRKAVEFAEDDIDQGWIDLQKLNINENDNLIGIAASGTTPYVIGSLKNAQLNNILTACICCNNNSPLSKYADHKIEAIVGPEFVTGSTRMKAGTAQKLILNMISTSVMIKLGKVKGNKMVDMQLSNSKLVERGTKMIMEATTLDQSESKKRLLALGSVRAVLDDFKNNGN